MLPAENNTEMENSGTREIPFSREIWIEQEDFKENPEKKFHRLGPSLMVRLKNAYIIKCESFKKDDNGNMTEIYCTYFPESKSGHDKSGIQVKGVIHWVDVQNAVPCEVRLYDRLFKVEDPSSEEGDFKDYINPHSLDIIPNALAEPSLKKSKPGDKFQFMRKGYFCVDKDSTADKIIFNRTVTLKDSWAKEAQKK
jgi:glutaminyl-tRNA synthetase